MQHAIIRTEGELQTVENCIVYQPGDPLHLPAGLHVEVIPEGVWIGWTRTGDGPWSPPVTEWEA